MDVDFIPSHHLREYCEMRCTIELISPPSPTTKHPVALVIPAFESKSDDPRAPPIREFEEMRNLWKEGKVEGFHTSYFPQVRREWEMRGEG